MQDAWLLVQVKLSEIRISSFLYYFNVLYYIHMLEKPNPQCFAAGKMEGRVAGIVSEFCAYAVYEYVYMWLTSDPNFYSKILKVKFWTLMCAHVCILWWIFIAEVRLCRTMALGFPFNFKFTVNLHWVLCSQFSASLLWLVYYEA